MESLKWIQQIVFRDFSNLEANIISTSEILHVFRLKKDQKGLKYLPNFHVIFQAHKDNLTVRLVTFHGKTVDSLVFKKTENDEDIPDHIKDFMFKYSSEDMQLCQGIKREDALNVIEEHLIEFLNDVVIVRSIKCKFTIKSDISRCEECTKIIPSIKVEPVVMTKIEHAESELLDVIGRLASGHKATESVPVFVGGRRHLAVVLDGRHDDARAARGLAARGARAGPVWSESRFGGRMSPGWPVGARKPLATILRLDSGVEGQNTLAFILAAHTHCIDGCVRADADVLATCTDWRRRPRRGSAGRAPPRSAGLRQPHSGLAPEELRPMARSHVRGPAVRSGGGAGGRLASSSSLGRMRDSSSAALPSRRGRSKPAVAARSVLPWLATSCSHSRIRWRSMLLSARYSRTFATSTPPPQIP